MPVSMVVAMRRVLPTKIVSQPIIAASLLLILMVSLLSMSPSCVLVFLDRDLSLSIEIIAKYRISQDSVVILNSHDEVVIERLVFPKIFDQSAQ